MNWIEMVLRHTLKMHWRNRMVLSFMLLNLTEITQALWLVELVEMSSEDLIGLLVTCNGVLATYLAVSFQLTLLIIAQIWL